MAKPVKDKKPKIHKHELSGLEYLRGAKKVLFETGVIIDREEFDKRINVDIKDYLSYASEKPENCNYDFLYAATTGRIRKKRGYGNNPRRRRIEVPEEPIQKEEPVKEPSPPGTPWPEEQKEVPAKRQFSSVFFITIIIAAIGLGSAVMSGYHTASFLLMSGKPFWASLATGVVMIMFSVVAFTSGRLLIQEKSASAFFGVVFIVLGLGVVAFSMFSTIAVNYSQFQWEEQKETTEFIESSTELAIADETRQAYLEEVMRLDREIEQLQQEAEGWKDSSWRRYDEYVQRIDMARRSREDTWRLYMDAGTDRLAAEGRIAAHRTSIYAFMSTLFSVPEDMLRFMVYVVPSVFYDIAAPFALSVVLFLIDRKRKRPAEV